MKLGQQLPLERCPRCARYRPTLNLTAQSNTSAFDQSNLRTIAVYVCVGCGGAILASATRHPNGQVSDVDEIVPSPTQLNEAIPEVARRFLDQARESIHVPDGAVMLAASAVDALLKAKGYRDGSLNARIKVAVNDNLLTPDMGLWAHQVRLEANNSRHVDEAEPHASETAAKQSVEFALALANIMFELPARVTRGLKEAGGTPIAEGGVPLKP
jgi:hypothetical protein